MKQFIKYGVLLVAGATVVIVATGLTFDPEIAVAEALLHKADGCRMEINQKNKDFGKHCMEYARFKSFLVGPRLMNKWVEELQVGATDRSALERRTDRVMILDQVIASEERLAAKKKACIAGADLPGCATVEELLPSYK